MYTYKLKTLQIYVLSLLFFKINSSQENRLNLSFYNKNCSERFFSICGQKMFNGFLQFCKLKLISNLILGQIIVSNLTNVNQPHKLRSTLLNQKKTTNIKYNNSFGNQLHSVAAVLLEPLFRSVMVSVLLMPGFSQ